MEIKGENILLQNVEDSDLEFVYRQSLKRSSGYFLLDEKFGPRSIEDIQSEWRAWQDNIFLIKVKDTHILGIVKFGATHESSRETIFSYCVFNPRLILNQYSIEAIQAVKNHFFSLPNITRVMARVLAFEKDYIALLEKSGFKLEAVLRSHFYFKRKYFDILIFGILKEEFRA